MTRWPAAIACLCTLGAFAAGHARAAAISVADDAGNSVNLARPAVRIVSLAPHATELLFAAGAGPHVVGVVAYSDWPREALSLPNVGDATALDLERIVALAPDLVVGWPYTMPAQLAALRSHGTAIFVSDPKSIAAIARDVEALGVLAGTASVAKATAAQLRARHAALSAKYAGLPGITVFYEVWNDPLQTIGGHHLISEAIALCGGANVFAALPMPAPTVSMEAVIAARPEAIVAGSDDGKRPAWLNDWARWDRVPAVRYGNLFVADGNLLHRSGPRFIDGVAALCGQLEQARINRNSNRQSSPVVVPANAGNQ